MKKIILLITCLITLNLNAQSCLEEKQKYSNIEYEALGTGLFIVQDTSITKNFTGGELVPMGILHTFGKNSHNLIDPRIFQVLQYLRGNVGPIIINDHNNYNFSGYRPQCAGIIGAHASYHKLGMAFDAHPSWVTYKELYDFIIAHECEIMQITGGFRLEHYSATPGWVHFDLGATGEFKIFKP